MTHQLFTYHERAPFGGVSANMLWLRGDEALALAAALDDRADIIRRQKAERADMVDAGLIDRLNMLARHRGELHEINDRINHIKQLGA
jgi:predicted TIM-barrel enzyme